MKNGAEVRAVDIKPEEEWYQCFSDAENLQLDLCQREACDEALDQAAEVYNLAADMGGMGFIENNKAACMLSVLINTHLLLAARSMRSSVTSIRSSACVYAAEKQHSTRWSRR